jgi:hypothetical protein
VKIIISHDVDHITAFEHNNLIIPKHILRNVIEIISGYISPSEFLSRIKDLANNKWHNLESLMRFNKENNIPSTFFFGVKNGVGLDYDLKDAECWVRKVMDEGYAVGVHGIAFDDHSDIKIEYDIFSKISGLNEFGIRMHYLRKSNATLTYLNESGYVFDTSLYKQENPYKVGTMWEFPLHIMDGYIICRGSRWQNQSLMQSKETTKMIIENCFNRGIKYFTVLFHDRYFSDSYITWKEWYIWLIHYLIDNKFSFIDYRSAIGDLEQSITNTEFFHEGNLRQ